MSKPHADLGNYDYCSCDCGHAAVHHFARDDQTKRGCSRCECTKPPLEVVLDTFQQRDDA